LEPIEVNIKKHVDNSFVAGNGIGIQRWLLQSSRIAQKAHKEGTTLKDMAVKLGYVTPEQFDEWVVPANIGGEGYKS